MKYDGISRETLFLLAYNRFRNSKEFYDEHKEELKSGVTVPMRQIAGIISSEFAELDPLMVTNPVKMVSRIRRDTRYTKDQSLYRENMWIMFMRDKHAWHGYPAFWFEVSPSWYSMGIGIYATESGQMQLFRKYLRERPDEFLKCAKKCEKTGAYIFGSEYKRMPDGCPAGLENYYSHKEFGFIKESGNVEDLADEGIFDIIRRTYKAYSPMFSFLLEISDEYYSKGE